jgi:hypothetical protein
VLEQDIILPHTQISWASSTQWLVQFCTLTLQRRTHIHVLVVHNQKKPNIYVTLQGAKFKPGITLVQQQLASSLYFQAPYYINFFFYFLKTGAKLTIHEV